MSNHEQRTRNVDKAYIGGAFVTVKGTEVVEVLNPATEQQIGTATLASRDDAKLAIAAAARAQEGLGRSTTADRIEMLRRLQAAVLARTRDICDITIEEYGAPSARAQWISRYASQCFANAADLLQTYEFTRRIGSADVFMRPIGVAALIAPWNSTAGSICSKLASALAAGCASIIKPSELSPLQSHVVTEALHDAGLPAGVFNVVVGRGTDVGDELSNHADVARVSFTGSTSTGKLIARTGAETMKRVSLSLTGKSASILLNDADLASAVPLAVNAAFMNNGQACVAGTRMVVPRTRLAEITGRVRAFVAQMRVGDPRDPETQIGPLASHAQFERVQHFIRRGLQQGATLVTGGLGMPAELSRGYFVQPTVFAGVHNDMDIARHEIFGPVLSILAYDSEEEAIRIANDSLYGLHAYVFSSRLDRARRVAAVLEAGTVLINRIHPELVAPFGGVKQSGIGREFGVFGLEAFLEPKAIVTA